MSSITERINTIVSEKTSGNIKKFAEITGIKETTFYNYTNGRNPNLESLKKICIAFKINLNWLVTGIGEKYIEEEKRNVECDFLETVDEWVSELKKEDPESEAWFKFEFKKLFPDFKTWLQRKSGTEGCDTSISKVA
ncbi:MAG: XRE family transcriptional regulator [Candidatus Electrothrix sp. ATG2]|nr:XRE family transcriptional regulator [Candidatus Electrothrix sp. ATG2]